MKPLIIMSVLFVAACSSSTNSTSTSTSPYIGTWSGNTNGALEEITILKDGKFRGKAKGGRDLSGAWNINNRNMLSLYLFGKRSSISGKYNDGLIDFNYGGTSFKLLPKGESVDSGLLGSWYATKSECIDEDRNVVKTDENIEATFNPNGLVSLKLSLSDTRCGLMRLDTPYNLVQVNLICAIKILEDNSFQCFGNPLEAELVDGGLEFTFKNKKSYRLNPKTN